MMEASGKAGAQGAKPESGTDLATHVRRQSILGVRWQAPILVASDLLALAMSFAVLAYVNHLVGRDGLSGEQALPFLILVPAWLLAAQATGLYGLPGRRVGFSFADEVGPVFLITTGWAWLMTLVTAALVSGPTQVLGPGVLWVATIVFVLASRALLRSVAQRRGWFVRRALLVGDGAAQLAEVLGRQRAGGLVPIGVLDATAPPSLRPLLQEEAVSEIPVPASEAASASEAELVRVMRESHAEHLVIASSTIDPALRLRLTDAAIEAGVSVEVALGDSDALIPASGPPRHLEGVPLMELSTPQGRAVTLALKRFLDILVSALALIVLSPALALLALGILIESPGRALFRQLRAGRHETTFEILKLRTMYSDAEGQRAALKSVEGEGLLKLEDDPRVTRLGGWLRRWSLDELPQLWNVLRGDMSLIGPRPLPLDEAVLARGRYAVRSEMRPGITGAWQVYGRGDIPLEEMLKLDYSYVMSWSLGEDLRILLLTLGAVLSGRGAR